MIQLVRGELATVAADCILRPVRSDGAPVDAAGRRLESAAGPEVSERLAAQGDSPLGTAYLTPAGDVVASFLVHVVVQSPEDPVSLLSVRRALVNGLRRATELGMESLALPPLGAGAGNLEVEKTARLMVEVLTDHLAGGAPPRVLRLVVHSDYEEQVFQSLLAEATHTPGT